MINDVLKFNKKEIFSCVCVSICLIISYIFFLKIQIATDIISDSVKTFRKLQK